MKGHYTEQEIEELPTGEVDMLVLTFLTNSHSKVRFAFAPMYSKHPAMALRITECPFFRKCWYFSLSRGDGLDSSDESHLWIATFSTSTSAKQYRSLSEHSGLAISRAALKAYFGERANYPGEETIQAI